MEKGPNSLKLCLLCGTASTDLVPNYFQRPKLQMKIFRATGLNVRTASRLLGPTCTYLLYLCYFFFQLSLTRLDRLWSLLPELNLYGVYRNDWLSGRVCAHHQAQSTRVACAPLRSERWSRAQLRGRCHIGQRQNFGRRRRCDAPIASIVTGHNPTISRRNESTIVTSPTIGGRNESADGRTAAVGSRR